MEDGVGEGGGGYSMDLPLVYEKPLLNDIVKVRMKLVRDSYFIAVLLGYGLGIGMH